MRCMASICVVGAGYVGLATAACLAELGHVVRCVDLDERKVSLINSGKSPIYEPGLGELVSRNVKEKRLSATTSLADAVSKCDFSFLCVGTPSADDGSTDLSHVKKAAVDLGKALAGKTGRHVLVVKSTVPPGTTESLGPLLQDAGV